MTHSVKGDSLLQFFVAGMMIILVIADEKLSRPFI